MSSQTVRDKKIAELISSITRFAVELPHGWCHALKGISYRVTHLAWCPAKGGER